MSQAKPIHCIVDDTPLTTNLEEVGPWVQNGTVALVVPLYTLERLHLLKKDASQIGQNARKAVKFLDHVTSTADLPHDPVVIQGPDDQYAKWSEVEARYTDAIVIREEPEDLQDGAGEAAAKSTEEPLKDDNVSTEKLVEDLRLTSDDIRTSPLSTPPLSPSNSEPQSNKTSPEVQCATMAKREATPVPPTFKPLINFVVWYTFESKDVQEKDIKFLTNSADAAQIAKDFGISTKTIHQLRASLGSRIGQTQSIENKQKKKPSNRTSSFKDEAKPQTLFRYEDASSEDEELVFKPRPRDVPRPTSSGRGGANVPFRSRGAIHSPSNSVNNPATPKPQVPVEEIDPDSFDRGTFARGSTPLANVGNHYGPPPNVNNGFNRGGQRNFTSPMPRGSGGNGYRGNTFRGRGRGRLFVP